MFIIQVKMIVANLVQNNPFILCVLISFLLFATWKQGLKHDIYSSQTTPRANFAEQKSCLTSCHNPVLFQGLSTRSTPNTRIKMQMQPKLWDFEIWLQFQYRQLDCKGRRNMYLLGLSTHNEELRLVNNEADILHFGKMKSVQSLHSLGMLLC